MLSMRQLARIAMRYDTTMSRAMLRALGLPVPEPMPCAGQVVEVAEDDGQDSRPMRHSPGSQPCGPGASRRSPAWQDEGSADG